MTDQDRAYILKALELAKRAQGKTHPNPAVGCVIVKDGKVGAVWHSVDTAGPAGYFGSMPSANGPDPVCGQGPSCCCRFRAAP